MRTYTRKFALPVLAAGAAALVLGACAPGEVESDAPAESGPVEVETVDPAEFAGETLDYVYFTDGPDEQATRGLIAKFEEEYDVTVNLEILPFADLVTSVQARLSGNNAPDVMRLTSLADFRGDLLDLRTFVGEDYADEFIEGTLTAPTGENGELFAVPSDLTLNAPFVNVDLFEQAGVALPDPADPWTWEEMITAAEQVQEATGTPYAFAMDKSGHRLSTILSQHGTSLVSAEGATLDAEAAVAALDPLVQLMAEDKMPRDFWLGSGSRYQGANEIFLAQETPVYLSGNWQVAQFATNAEFNWAAVPNPCAVECGGFPGGKFMAALEQSDNQALAAEFVRFMNTTENQAEFVAASMFLPTRQDLAEDGVTYPDRQEDMDVILQDVARTPAVGYEANAHPAFSGSATALVNELSAVVAGQKDLPTAITDTQAAITALVEEVG